MSRSAGEARPRHVRPLHPLHSPEPPKGTANTIARASKQTASPKKGLASLREPHGARRPSSALSPRKSRVRPLPHSLNMPRAAFAWAVPGVRRLKAGRQSATAAAASPNGGCSTCPADSRPTAGSARRHSATARSSRSPSPTSPSLRHPLNGSSSHPSVPRGPSSAAGHPSLHHLSRRLRSSRFRRARRVRTCAQKAMSSAQSPLGRPRADA